MEITTFNPMIITANANELIALFEELGFCRRHAKGGLNGENITDYRLKHPSGFYVDVVQRDGMERDRTLIRMNVRDFDEAYDLLEEHGFKNAQGERISQSASSKGTSMVAPTGFAIALSHHFRKE